MSDLDNRLESLTDVPAPAMAPAALVRRRGEQRRRRTRLSVAAVSAAVLVTGGFAYESLSGSWNDRAVPQFANTPTPTPTPTPIPAHEANPHPGHPRWVVPTLSQRVQPRETGLTSSHDLRRDGIGGVTVGMTVAEAQAAARQRFVQEGDVLGNCIYMAPKTDFFGLTPSVDGAARWPAVQFMFIDGVMSRVDVYPGGKVRTSAGIGIGSTEQQVKDAYPGIIVEPHWYKQPAGHYLHLKPDNNGHSMNFETDGVLVTGFYSGHETAVIRVEGCA